MTSERCGLMADAFHKTAVTGNYEHMMAMRIGPKPSTQMTLSDGHSDSVGKSLTKWAGRNFYSCCVTRLGVTRRGGTPLAKRT